MRLVVVIDLTTEMSGVTFFRLRLHSCSML